MSKKRRDKDFLGDINEAMNLIGLYTKGLTYRNFFEDRKAQDAVVCNFEQVVGEASKNITVEFQVNILRCPVEETCWIKETNSYISQFLGYFYGQIFVWSIASKEIPQVA